MIGTAWSVFFLFHVLPNWYASSQRNDDPTKAGDKGGDNGTYVYFDYNFVHDDNTAGWCYRIKPDFVFDQDALEKELA